MAYVGAAKPYIARLVDEKKKTYAECFKCGKLMKVNITPNYNEAKLHADNQLSEYEKEFKDGNISLGTDRLPVEASDICFGHKISADGRKVTYKTNDAANYVGFGFYVTEVIDSVRRYVASVIFKVKFGEAANEYTTKGENLEFKTPSIEGTIAGLSTGEWKETFVCDTEDEADEWLRETFGYKEPETPDTSSTSAYVNTAVKNKS